MTCLADAAWDGATLSALGRSAVVPTTRDAESYGDGSSSPVQEKLAADSRVRTGHLPLSWKDCARA